MNAIAKITEREDVRKQWDPTYAAFLPLLEANRSAIEATKRETFKYGETVRHKLDIYYPPNPEPNTKYPIIFYSYLGGLEIGDRILPESNGLIYHNFGTFFATKGFIFVVADYRLVPLEKGNAKYPDCLHDTLNALSFLFEPTFLGSTPQFSKIADKENVFLFGHSAGALNQSSLLLNPFIFPITHPLRQNIKGVIWNGGSFHFDNVYSGMPLEEYYGPTNTNNHIRCSSLGLLHSAPKEYVDALPPMLIIAAEWETSNLFEMVGGFVDGLRKRGVRDFTEYENKGHNHLSSYLSLMSGEGDEWGYEVVRWVRARLN